MITVGKRSCRKVMFSQACFKNSVLRGEVYTPVDQTPPCQGGVYSPSVGPPGQTHPLGRHPWADTPTSGRHPSVRQTPLPQADTPPSGRHPWFSEIKICQNRPKMSFLWYFFSLSFSYFEKFTIIYLLLQLNQDAFPKRKGKFKLFKLFDTPTLALCAL